MARGKSSPARMRLSPLVCSDKGRWGLRSPRRQATRTDQNRAIEIQQFAYPETSNASYEATVEQLHQDMRRCQVLYSTRTRVGTCRPSYQRLGCMASSLSATLMSLRKRGGMVEPRLSHDVDRLTFRINLAALRRANIKISAILLSMATIIGKN